MIQKVKAIYPKVNRLESKIEYVNFDSVYRTFLKYISSYRAYPFLYFRFLLIILIKFIKYSDSPVILPLKKNEVEVNITIKLSFFLPRHLGRYTRNAHFIRFPAQKKLSSKSSTFLTVVFARISGYSKYSEQFDSTVYIQFFIQF